MSDTFGAERIPLAVPAADFAVGDAALTHLVRYLYAFLVTDGNATAAWQASRIAPGVPAVKEVFTHDPRKVVFNRDALPGLFAFREGTYEETEQAGDDVLVERGTITVYWVFPTRPQAPQASRLPFVNGLAKCIERAVHRGQTPSYVIAGDTDRGVATEGSLLWGASCMALFDLPRVRRWRPTVVTIEMADGPSDHYDALELTLEIAESLDFDDDAHPEIAGWDFTYRDERGNQTQTSALPSSSSIDRAGWWAEGRAILNGGADEPDADVAMWTALAGPSGVAGAAVPGTAITNDYPRAGAPRQGKTALLPTLDFAGGRTTPGPSYLFEAFDHGPMTDLITSSGFVFLVVCKPRVVYAAAAEIYDCQAIVADTLGYLGLVLRGGEDGPVATLYHYDNAFTADTVDVPVRMGEWVLLVARHEAGRIYLSTGYGDVEVSTPSGNTDGAFDGRLLVGRNGGALNAFNGQVGELVVKATMTPEELASERDRLMRRWAIAQR